MEVLFVSRSLLFVGCSLEGIEAYLRGIKFRGRGPYRHYAVVAVTGSTWRAKADSLLHRYGIDVLPYGLTVNHPELQAFVERLLADVRPAPRSPAAAPSPEPKVLGLKRVHLENIGPFEALHLTLHERWNVFLGNNGVGKSSILRAAAAAVCGQDAGKAAEPIISSAPRRAR